MAGFRRLCGRFLCEGGAVWRGGSNGAKYRRLRCLWGVMLVVWQGRGVGGLRAHARGCFDVLRGC